MSTYNDLQALRSLSKEVMAEVIREGENRLNAQLTVATAADQRALAIAGSQLTAATASLAGGIALAGGTKPDLWLAFVAIGFALALVIAAYAAIDSVRPQEFDFPGNRPGNWLPDLWLGADGGVFTLAQARIEQASCIDDSIRANTLVMGHAGQKVRRSLDITVRATAFGAVLLILTLVARNWTIAEPVSEIIRLR